MSFTTPRSTSRQDPRYAWSKLLAPSTLPTMLYLLLKNLNQSLSTVFFSSSRSYHSGTQSSAFNDDEARARDGSLPANTASFHLSFIMAFAIFVWALRTVIRASRLVGFVSRHIKDNTFDRDVDGFVGVAACGKVCQLLPRIISLSAHSYRSPLPDLPRLSSRFWVAAAQRAVWGRIACPSDSHCGASAR